MIQLNPLLLPMAVVAEYLREVKWYELQTQVNWGFKKKHMCSNVSHNRSYILISRQIPFVVYHAAGISISALEKTE